MVGFLCLETDVSYGYGSGVFFEDYNDYEEPEQGDDVCQYCLAPASHISDNATPLCTDCFDKENRLRCGECDQFRCECA